MAYSPEERERIVEHICVELEKKRFASKICAEDEGMPSFSQFLAWCAENPQFQSRYAQAREAQVEALLEEGLQIAEDATDDAYIWTDPKTNRQFARIDGKTVRRSQLIIETRERFAKMMLPERFAQQRMDVTSGGKALPAPVQINDNRIQALLQLAAHRAQQLSAPIDVTPLALSDVMDEGAP